MTPCEDLGYKVGDKFDVVSEHDGVHFNVGDLVILKEDDGSNRPLFQEQNSDLVQYVYLNQVKKITTANDDWITWSGGKCPVPKGTLVDVKHRSGDYYFNRSACENERVKSWDHSDHIGDIIAYRLSDSGIAGSSEKENDAEPEDVKLTTDNTDAFIIVTLISGVCPGMKVEDALEISATLIEEGFKR